MAVVVPLTSTLPNNKRSGVTFYKSVLAPNTGVAPPTYKLMARATAVPVQPATLPQAVAQNILSTVANAWSALSANEQSYWATGYNALVGYQYYTAVNTYWVTWGLGTRVLPPGYAEFSGDLLISTPATSTNPPIIVAFETLNAYPLNGYYLALYIQVSGLIPSYSSGIAGVMPASVAAATGYVYIGYVGPTADSTLLPVDLTDIVTALYGQPPMSAVSQPGEYRTFGSVIDLQVVVSDGVDNQYFYEYVEEASPTPSYWLIPFSFATYAALAPSAAAARLAPKRTALATSAARFYPAPHLWATLDRTRRARGLPAIGRAGYRAGLPTA